MNVFGVHCRQNERVERRGQYGRYGCTVAFGSQIESMRSNEMGVDQSVSERNTDLKIQLISNMIFRYSNTN